jgi:hypothetical protein
MTLAARGRFFPGIIGVFSNLGILCHGSENQGKQNQKSWNEKKPIRHNPLLQSISLMNWIELITENIAGSMAAKS